MNLCKTTNWIWRWIGSSLLALGMAAEAEPQTKTRVLDKTTERNPDSAVRVTTRTYDMQSRTTGDSGRWQSTQSGTQSKTTETDLHGEWDENRWEGEAGLKNDTKVKVQSRLGNATAQSLGATKLEEPETVWQGETGPSCQETFKGKLGTATVKASGGAKGSVLAGENGYELKGQAGLEAEVRATTQKLSIGDKNLGASLKGSGRLEASAIAKGRLGGYVDDKGITFGAEGSAGVYVKGELKMNMEAHVFGVKTNVNLVASGYAGALAEGKAVVTLGWNGKVSFMASLGASLGFGGGLAVEFEMDAEELMKKLNFTDVAQLLEWMKEFQENPKPVLAKLGIQALRKLHESGFGLLKKLGSQGAGIFEKQVMSPLQKAGGSVKEGVGKGLAFLGRLIHAPRGEAENVAVNTCLQQVEEVSGTLAQNQAGQSSMEFPLCLMDLLMGVTGMKDWEGFDPYLWYPFDWPTSYNWPSL